MLLLIGEVRFAIRVDKSNAMSVLCPSELGVSNGMPFACETVSTRMRIRGL